MLHCSSPHHAQQAKWAADLRFAARLLEQAEAMVAAERERCANFVRNAASYGLCCSDSDALADLLLAGGD
jgi:hypothetical protein